MINVPIDFLRENPDRYRKLVKGQRVDYAPYRLWLDQTFVCDFAKVNPREYATNLDVMFGAQKKVNERFYDLRDYSVDIGLPDVYFDQDKFKSENPNKTPWKFLEDSLDNFDRYYTKKKIADLPSVKYLQDGIDYFNAKLPRDQYVNYYLGCTGAMDLFSIFRGTEHFFMDLYDQPAKVKKIFEYLTERSLELLEYEEKTWGDYNRSNVLFDKIDVGEDYCAYLQPDLFDEFVTPYTGKLFAKYKGKVCCSLHTDGDFVSGGIGVLNHLGLDELMGFAPNADITEYRAALPDVILGGNIHPIKHMIEGTPADVKAAAKYCFENASQNQKFVLCTGGAITAGAKPENVDAFLEACYEVVKYE